VPFGATSRTKTPIAAGDYSVERHEDSEAARRSAAFSEQEAKDLLVTKYGVGYRLALRRESIEVIE